jgi:hypothetical protein
MDLILKRIRGCKHHDLHPEGKEIFFKVVSVFLKQIFFHVGLMLKETILILIVVRIVQISQASLYFVPYRCTNN